jgi:transposase
MSVKERKRLLACSRVAEGHISLLDAARICGLSYRQMRRVWSRYRENGEEGLVHRSRGRSSNRGADETTRREVLARYAERYPDFGPTLAAEKLALDGFVLDHETLRRWLAAEGLWKARPRRHPYRSARPRRSRFGELVQLDGSFHDWLEGRGERGCLMQMVDDATGTRVALMCREETTADAMRVLKRWIERYGIPLALYTDRKSVYVTDREPTIEEALEAREPLTEFGRACDDLGIQIIAAHSPQAKGRVERAHKTLQDRLVKELRLAGVSTIESSDEFMCSGYLDSLNARFSVEPADPVDAHRALRRDEDLDSIFSHRESRRVGSDYTLTWHRHSLQLLKARHLPAPGGKVEVAVHLDGSLHVSHLGRELSFERIHKRRAPESSGLPKAANPPDDHVRTPAPNHPWKRPYRDMPVRPPAVIAAIANSQAHVSSGLGMGQF